MPTYGGLTPQPERTGGARPLLRLLIDSLNRAHGTAYDTSEESPIYAENAAYARAIWEAWETNQRLANQWLPRFMTSTLDRWLQILCLPRIDRENDNDRRARIAEIWNRFGVTPTRQVISDLLAAKLGDLFVSVIRKVPSNAVSWWPANPGTNQPYWYSTIAHILVKVQRPASYSEQQFWDTISQLNTLLDGRLPAWCTFDWYRNGPHSNGDWPLDTEAGFFLDDDHNLDYEVFDS